MTWSVKDVIDFEYLLANEAGLDPLQLWQRDREIFESHIQKTIRKEKLRDRRIVFRSWLEARRNENSYLPGEDLTSSWRFLVSVLIAAAFFFGLIHAGALLALEKDNHVSAVKMFILTVGLQLFLTACGLAFYFGRRTLQKHYGGFDSLRLFVANRLLRRLGNSKLRRALSCLDGRHGPYKALALGHVVKATQACFIAMSLGILASLFVYHFAYRDVRFGWSTTHEWEAADIARAVNLISLPWERLVPKARPTLTQIEESHLTEDIPGKRVSAAASRAWAMFLVASIVFYGIILRFLLVLIAAARLRRQRRSLQFAHAEADQLWKRLNRPLPGAPRPPPTVGEPRLTWWERIKKIFRRKKKVAAG